MYRQYENPRELENRLDEMKRAYETELAQCESENERFDIIEYYAQAIAELEDRVNFAWQDEEYLCNCARYEY